MKVDKTELEDESTMQSQTKERPAANKVGKLKNCAILPNCELAL